MTTINLSQDLTENLLNNLDLNEKQEVIVVPENFCIYNYLSVGKNVALFLAKKSSQELAEKESLNALTKVGLAHHFEMFPGTLSTLEKKQLAILRGLVQYPDLLLIEEPFSALDQEQGEEMAMFINSLLELQSKVAVVTANKALAAKLNPQVICG